MNRRALGGARLVIGLAAALPACAAAGAFALDPAGFFPAAGSIEVCPDAPLRLHFNSLPSLGAGRFVRVYAAEDRRLVAAIDVGSSVATQAIGGIPDFHYRPVILSGRDAQLFLPNPTLAYASSYYVTIDAGAFSVAGDPCAAISEPAAWSFKTRAAPPAADAGRLTVAADGTGDFCTLQGALDFLPVGSRAPTTIVLRAGTYTEIVAFANKHRVTILGADRRRTVLAYANNARFNPGNGNPYGSAAGAMGAGAKPRSIYHRGVFLADQADDLVLANLTIRNLTPQGGSQAEAIILNGGPSAHAVLKDVDLYSYQDTLQINGQAYVADCFITGDVDFLWGKGPCFFEDCTFRALRSGAYYAQVRNPAANHGFVFKRCGFDGAPGVVDNYLARIELNRFPASEVVLLDCTLGPSVGSAGWQLQGSPAGTRAPETLHFWEAGSRDPAGRPIDPSRRLAGSRQLDRTADAARIERYSDPVFVLGGAWDPRPMVRRLTPLPGSAAAAPGP